MARVGFRTLLVAGVCASTAISGSSVGVAASTTPPVVSITMTGTKATISGAGHLHPGWTTIKLTVTKGENALWLYVPRGGALGSKASGTAAAVHRVRAQDPATPPSPDDPVYQQQQADEQARHQRAADVTTSEDAITSLGGIDATKGRSRSVTLKLPAGDVTVADLVSDSDDPVVVLHVKGSATKAKPAKKVSFTVTDDDNDYLLVNTRKAPHVGTVRVSILGKSRYNWHQFQLVRLDTGKRQGDAAAFCAAENPTSLPFITADSATASPLSAKHTVQFSYSLPKGSYVLMDTWIDHETGMFYCAEGAVRALTLT